MINQGLMSSNSSEWATPQDLFDKLNKMFNFTLDPCATAENAKCKKFYTMKENGLVQDWSGETVFCNPPYGRDIAKWVEKAYNEAEKGVKAEKGTRVVMLLPARTDTRWFHNYIYHKHNVYFLPGRLHFNESKQSAPFPSMIVVMVY